MDSKRQKRELPYELVEEIFVRLPVKSILRFKSVSKSWKSTIESRYFGERHCSKRFQKNQLTSIYAVKPATRWFQQILSPSSLQLFIDNERRQQPNPHGYKLVVCSSSSAVSTSTCQVFEFGAATWRYVAYTSRYRIVGSPFFRGVSLYWFTQPCDDDGFVRVEAFDLLNENFETIWSFEFDCDNDYAMMVCVFGESMGPLITFLTPT